MKLPHRDGLVLSKAQSSSMASVTPAGSLREALQ